MRRFYFENGFRIRKTALILLCAVICASVCACAAVDGGNEDLTAPDRTASSVSESPATEVSAPVFVSVSECANNAACSVWLAESMERVQTRYALICSLNAEDSICHCWFYAEEGDPESSVSFFRDSQTSDLYSIRYVQSENTDHAEQAEGVWYFTIRTDRLPQFELLSNGEWSGLSVTYSDDSVAR